MSRRSYRPHSHGGLSTAVDDTTHIAASFGPVGALWTGTIGFGVFYTALPLCMMAWTAERKASIKGPAAAAFASLLDQTRSCGTASSRLANAPASPSCWCAGPSLSGSSWTGLTSMMNT